MRREDNEFRRYKFIWAFCSQSPHARKSPHYFGLTISPGNDYSTDIVRERYCSSYCRWWVFSFRTRTYVHHTIMNVGNSLFNISPDIIPSGWLGSKRQLSNILQYCQGQAVNLCMYVTANCKVPSKQRINHFFMLLASARKALKIYSFAIFYLITFQNETIISKIFGRTKYCARLNIGPARAKRVKG